MDKRTFQMTLKDVYSGVFSFKVEQIVWESTTPFHLSIKRKLFSTVHAPLQFFFFHKPVT